MAVTATFVLIVIAAVNIATNHGRIITRHRYDDHLGLSTRCSDCMDLCDTTKNACDAILFGSLSICERSYERCLDRCDSICDCDQECNGECQPELKSCNSTVLDNQSNYNTCHLQNRHCLNRCRLRCSIGKDK